MGIKIKQRKPYLVKEVGEWKFTFHYKEGSIERTFLSITSASGIFNCRIGGNAESYGTLLLAATKNDTVMMHNFITYLYNVAMGLGADVKFPKEIHDVVMKMRARLDKQSEKRAAEVTDVQEQASQVFMEDVAAYADATPKERKKMREADKAEMRAVLNEKEGENGE